MKVFTNLLRQLTPIEVSRLIQFLIVRNSEEQLVKTQEKLWSKYKYKYSKAVKRTLPCMFPFVVSGVLLGGDSSSSWIFSNILTGYK